MMNTLKTQGGKYCVPQQYIEILLRLANFYNSQKNFKFRRNLQWDHYQNEDFPTNNQNWCIRSKVMRRFKKKIPNYIISFAGSPLKKNKECSDTDIKYQYFLSILFKFYSVN